MKSEEKENSVASKIESYLIEMNMAYQSPSENIWIINDDIHHIDNVVVSYEDPIIIFRVKLMQLNQICKSSREKFFQTLLELNCTSLLHGAYAIEEDAIVIIDTLQAKNIDLNEFNASLDAINLAISSDYKILSKFLQK